MGERRSSTDRAVEALRSLIFSGQLGPGSDHLETELADRLGLSRTPVREAALILAAQGLVEVRPRKGLRVIPVSRQDMSEIYDVLTALESLAAESAARMNYPHQQLAALAETIARMEAALAANDRDGWAEADNAFHTELVRLGGNARISRIVRMMEDQVRRARAMTLYIRPLPVRSNEDHRRVLDAIAKGDAHAAYQIHHAHRRQAKEMLIDLLGKHRFHQL
ncbi:MAG: GntR family transcriptional regulator [Pseudomonadota bacterium]